MRAQLERWQGLLVYCTPKLIFHCLLLMLIICSYTILPGRKSWLKYLWLVAVFMQWNIDVTVPQVPYHTYSMHLHYSMVKWAQDAPDAPLRGGNKKCSMFPEKADIVMTQFFLTNSQTARGKITGQSSFERRIDVCISNFDMRPSDCHVQNQWPVWFPKKIDFR